MIYAYCYLKHLAQSFALSICSSEACDSRARKVILHRWPEIHVKKAIVMDSVLVWAGQPPSLLWPEVQCES